MGAVMTVFAIHHFAAESNDVSDDVSSDETIEPEKIITLDNYHRAVKTGFISFETVDLKDPRKCIHCTLSKDTQEKIEKFFPDQAVVILQLNLSKLDTNGFSLVFEANYPGGTKYPHLYHISGELFNIPINCVDVAMEP